MKNIFLLILYVKGVFLLTVETDMSLFMGAYYVSALFTENKFQLNLMADLDSQYTSLSSIYLIGGKDISNSLTTKNVTYSNKNNVGLIGDEYTGTLFLSDTKDPNLTKGQIALQNFMLYIFNVKPNFKHNMNVYAFGRKITDENHSVVYLLYRNHYIESKKFAFFFNGSYSKVFYGELPEKILSSYAYHLSVKSESHDLTTWEVPVTGVIIGGKRLATDFGMKFSTTDSDTKAPAVVMDLLEREIFAKAFPNKKCRKWEHRFVCNCDYVIKEIKDTITFLIDGHPAKINVSKLFYFHRDECHFEMSLNYWNKKKWVLGTSFLSKFIVQFDYDNDEISFYSQERNFFISDIEGVLEDNRRKIKNILLTLSVMTMLSILLLVSNVVSIRRFAYFFKDQGN